MTNDDKPKFQFPAECYQTIGEALNAYLAMDASPESPPGTYRDCLRGLPVTATERLTAHQRATFRKLMLEIAYTQTSELTNHIWRELEGMT